MNNKDNAKEAAQRFINEETAFHLGDLVTEQSHPLTRDLSNTIQRSTEDGLKLLLDVDQDIIPVAERTVDMKEFDLLIDYIGTTMESGGKVVFSSCGASGRLAIILESVWREYWKGQAYENQVLSIMTGGERALIRAVENFEDYQAFGRRQAQEAGITDKDLLIALTEGGEISSVIGTMKESVERKAKVFMLYNNPRELLIDKFERSREVLTHPDIVSIELTTGPMALSGSTRMQATTIGMLLVGIALEEAFFRISNKATKSRHEYIDDFKLLTRRLGQGDALKGLAKLTELEAKVYSSRGRLTYLAEKYLLDIFSDTTERTPTFMIPPFRPAGDITSPAPWTFAKDPTCPSDEAWVKMLKRAPRGIDWKADDYIEMQADQSIADQPPRLGDKDILSYQIGYEPDESRSRGPVDCFVPVLVNEKFSGSLWPGMNNITGKADVQSVCIGNTEGDSNCDIDIKLDIPSSKINLYEHLVVKIIFNTMSTGTMAKLRRINGNWMIQVDATNKKLIDRATRIIQHFSGLSYEQACHELFLTIHLPDVDRTEFKESYVLQTLRRLKIEM